MVAESPSNDRRAMASAWPTRITNLGGENQRLAILYDSRTQCTGFQEICNCHKEGTKWYAVGLSDNPRRRVEEGRMRLGRIKSVDMSNDRRRVARGSPK